MIFVPYTEIQTATKVALIGYDYKPVKVEGEYGYGEFFRERWKEGKSFIVIEHDCVPWPGAIEALMKCEEPWCAHNYGLPCHRENPALSGAGIPLGCTKIGARLIEETPGIWDAPVDWSHCDQQIPKYALRKVHQHFPGIINANPQSLGVYAIDWP